MQPSLAMWAERHRDLADVYVGLCDIHAIWRGKRIPLKKLARLEASPIRMPVSAAAVDIWGEDVRANPLFTATGDADTACLPTGRDPILIPGASALVPIWLSDEQGAPHPVDPRGALFRARRRCLEAGYTPCIGMELEFYLLNPAAPGLEPAMSAHSSRPFTSGTVLSLDELQSVQPFLDEVQSIAASHDIAADASVTEAGPGQFEIALAYCDDALKAADDVVILKYILRHVARRHGFEACFMAKPFPDMSGSGLHAHLSFLDRDGANVFQGGAPAGNAQLMGAVAGTLDALIPSTLIFAPHLNSYRRFAENSLAPTTASWGIESRTSAIRIPGGAPQARRLEHRVAGADANPYLVLAAILGAALDGMERAADPGPPLQNAYASDARRIPADWRDALSAFEAGEAARPLFDPLLSASIVHCKRQEMAVFARHMSELEMRSYRGVV